MLYTLIHKVRYLCHSRMSEGQLTAHNEEFFEHLTDHLQIAFCFFVLGFFICNLFWNRLTKKFRLDYDMEKGTFMKIEHQGKKKRWLIINPTTLFEWFDVAYLLIFDNVKGKYLDKHSKRRLRMLSIFTFAIMILISIWGVIMIFSAMRRDINPFNHLPW